MVTRILKEVSFKLQKTLKIIKREAIALQEASLSSPQQTSLRRILRATQRLSKRADSLPNISLTNLPLATSPMAKKAPFANILLVEDSPIIQKAHTDLLQNLGYHVDVASTGKEALTHFNKQYDVILMDVGLPDLSGITVTEKIRQLERKFVPIIMLMKHEYEELILHSNNPLTN